MSSRHLALSARGVGKVYEIVHTGARRSFRGKEQLWALKDVSFDIDHGEVIGVIGRNGAGKSTLLKVLSRITDPTEGRVDLYGRVGSLLEVGSGFHPELTGRENIYLSGGFLGMKRREISRHFDEIVDFSGVERFLDTPVKRYSSGMYVRLAFAVAAHLQPEILLVDEVLAVGDAAFQQKCLGKMEDVSKQGRAVLFVSHNMAAIEALCRRGLFLESGQLLLDGPLEQVIAEYHGRVFDKHGAMSGHEATFGPQYRFFRSARLVDSSGRPTNHLPMGTAFRIRFRVDAAEEVAYPIFTVMIDSSAGQRMLTISSPNTTEGFRSLDCASEVECHIPTLPLAPGDYVVRLSLWKVNFLERVEHALTFTVTNADTFGDGWGADRGVCVAPANWTLSADVAASIQKTSA